VKAQPFLGLYTFDSVKVTTGLTDPTAVPTATGVTFGSFSATGTPANPNAAARFSFTNWPLGSTGGVGDSLYSGMTGALSTGEYFEVTITPVSGFAVTLDTIRFSSRRSTTGCRSFAVRSSADGFAANLTAGLMVFNPNVNIQGSNEFFFHYDGTTNPMTNSNGNIILLAGGSFSGLTSPVTFRFYAWNAEATPGSFGIDNVAFIGSALGGVGIAENKTAAIALYPNPSANGLFNVDLGNVSGKSTVTVYDIVGKVILTKEVTTGNKQTLDLSAQANGCYFVNIKNDNGTITKKLTVSK
jgi:Secretion system C-terminal sorting domain